ncbi:creatininase [Corynebacterium vitaeruminis]|uniref:Amidase n=1 Tax=Corynebacterium vitaeruminis DSM 20294 TaxID=1224164 RepID=W5XX00_9CORY|nr:creatininase [Corynebacterium vitaeruminis]AHI21472.1 amidase [Corynebacterium vitaeruminis DSM 20294]
MAAHNAHEMTWEELRDSIEKVAILPVGSLEQHGPHLPLGTDTIIGVGIAQAVAEEIDAVVFPPVAYGYRSNPFSGGGPLFPGTVDLTAVTVMDLIKDILGEIIADGFTKVLIVNSHFENQFPIQEAMILVDEKFNHSATIIQTNWWDPLEPALIDEVFSEDVFPGWALEHGAVTETSLMMYLAPDAVREDRIPEIAPFTPPAYIRVPNRKSDIPAEGSLANAAHSSAQKGKLIAESACQGILKICAAEFS